MKNTVLTVVALLAFVFPFVMVGAELVQKEQIATVGVFVVMALLLFGTVALAFATTRSNKR
jgi:hypothetical protein